MNLQYCRLLPKYNKCINFIFASQIHNQYPWKLSKKTSVLFNRVSEGANQQLLSGKKTKRKVSKQRLKMPAEVEEYRVELDLGEPSEELSEYARNELGENPDTKAKAIQELRDMIFQNGEVTPHRTDDAFLTRFLRTRYFHVEKSYNLLVNYYNFKENNPDIHKDVHPLQMGHVGDDDVLTVPPYTDQLGRRLMIYKIGNWDPSKYPVEEIFRATVLVLELGILEARLQIKGGVCIFDLEGLSLQHAWNVTPSIAAKMIEFIVASFPMRTKAIHIINQSWVFDMIYAIFKPLLDERMREKIFFHGSDLESLHAHIDPKCLPKDFGGIHRTYIYSEWLESFRTNPFIIEEMRKLGYLIPDEEIAEYSILLKQKQELARKEKERKEKERKEKEQSESEDDDY